MTLSNEPDIEDILVALTNYRLINSVENWKLSPAQAKIFIYHRLAAEAVDMFKVYLDKNEAAQTTKAIPLSKLKAIMEIKE